MTAEIWDFYAVCTYLIVDSSGILVVQPCSKEMTAQIKAGKVPSIQNVMSLTMEQWRVINVITISKSCNRTVFRI